MRGGWKLVSAFVVALLAAFVYFASRSMNEAAGDVEHLTLTPAQEMALGAQAMPEVARRFGGDIDQLVISRYVDEVGQRLVHRSAVSQSPYQYEFHVLADPLTVDAFALPGGQISITLGLLSKLRSEAELAAVLSHELGHIVSRHGTAQLAKQRFAQKLVGALASTPYDPTNTYIGEGSSAIAAAVAQVVSMKFGREDELEADALAVRYLDQAGYDPRGMANLLEVLGEGKKRRHRPAFFGTHPSTANRLTHIRTLIDEQGNTGGELGEERFRENVLRYTK
jgi:beta-barrel assembly-enhancing protease